MRGPALWDNGPHRPGQGTVATPASLGLHVLPHPARPSPGPGSPPQGRPPTLGHIPWAQRASRARPWPLSPPHRPPRRQALRTRGPGGTPGLGTCTAGCVPSTPVCRAHTWPSASEPTTGAPSWPGPVSPTGWAGPCGLPPLFHGRPSWARPPGPRHPLLFRAREAGPPPPKRLILL